MSVSVLVVDDEPVVLAALQELLEADDRVVVTATAATSAEAIEAALARPPDVVLLDVRLPGGGAQACREIIAAAPATRVVALSAYTDPGVVAEMLHAGAVGYLPKGELADDVADVVVRCAAGQVLIATDSGAAALRRALGA